MSGKSGGDDGGLKFELTLKQAKKEEKKTADNKLVYVGIVAAALLIMFILSMSAQAAPYEDPRPPVQYQPSGQYQIPYGLPNGGGGPPRTPVPTPLR